MAILWTGVGNWSVWKMNWQKKCSWFSVWMFVLAQGTGRCWDFLSTAVLIYASLKSLPNYSLSLTVRDWLSQNLPLKLWIRVKKSVLPISFFFPRAFFVLYPCIFSMTFSFCHQKHVVLSFRNLPCDSFIQKLYWFSSIKHTQERKHFLWIFPASVIWRVRTPDQPCSLCLYSCRGSIWSGQF